MTSTWFRSTWDRRPLPRRWRHLQSSRRLPASTSFLTGWVLWTILVATGLFMFRTHPNVEATETLWLQISAFLPITGSRN